MKFYDFIGNELTIGCYCAYPGAGNVNAEYGMILYKVVGFDEDKGKVKAIRIFVEYGQGQNRDSFPSAHTKNAIYSTIITNDNAVFKVAVRYSITSIENTNKLALVYPNEQIKSAFEKIILSDVSVFDDVPAAMLGNWIHGSHHKLNIWENK